MYPKIIKHIVTFLIIFCLAACGQPLANKESFETVSFTDDAGRVVELKKEITKVAPSGAVATMILATFCPEYMVSVSGTPSSGQYKYLPERLMDLPTTGQLYGSKSTINLESLIKSEPQLIIDLGDRKDDITSSMNSLQKQTGITTIYLEADLTHISEAYRSLGKIFNKQEKAEEIASFIDETMEMAKTNSEKIDDAQRKSVMYTTGTSGLNTNSYGSTQAQVLEIVGAKNAIIVEDVKNSGGGNTIGLEQLYNFDPEVIVFAESSIYDVVSEMDEWAGLTAIKNNEYYEIPSMPYNWLSNPPSVNMVLGVWWLGNLLYPDVFDYDMVKAAQRAYDIFWEYQLTDEEARDMLANSTFKNGVRQ